MVQDPDEECPEIDRAFKIIDWRSGRDSTTLAMSAAVAELVSSSPLAFLTLEV